MSLFDEGRDDIAARTGWPCLGVVPWFYDAWKLPAEDMMDIRSHTGGTCKVVVPQLERMANFDDLDPLSAEPDVSVEIIPAGRPLPGDADLVSAAGQQIHHRGSGLFSSAGLGHRSLRPCAAWRARSGPVRRLSNAG